MSENKQKVALVLSSGGARGLAHIGVIEGLNEAGFEIASVAGSSMGAVVGAFYACGHLETYKKWVTNLDRLDVFNLIDFTFSAQGFIKGEKVFKTLEKEIPDCKIEDMDIPFAASATNISEEREVVIESGSMYDAIKASAAIPTVIKPVSKGDMNHIDGGVTNPLPVDRVKRHSGDLLVVSNVNANSVEKGRPLKSATGGKSGDLRARWAKLLPGNNSTDEKLGYFDLLNLSIDLMQDRMTTLILQDHRPDIQVNIARDACGTFEFYKAAEVVKLGKTTLQKAIKQYQESN